MSFTYAQLKDTIQDYTQYDEASFVANLPVFIEQAEERILKNVQLSVFRKNFSGSMTASNAFLACPNDFLAPYALSFTDSDSNQVFLEFKDPDFVTTFNPDASVTGNPRYYAVYDIDNFVLGPTPDNSYTIDLSYFYRPASLTQAGESGTTWLSENAKIALLYGSLIEAYIYMKGEPDIMQQYEKRFAEAIVGLKLFGESKEVTDQYRTGMVVRPKQ